MKMCIKCKEIKPLNDFNKSTSTKSGYIGNCRTCKKQMTMDWYARVYGNYGNYCKARMQRDPIFAAKEKIRHSIKSAIYKSKNKKTLSTNKILGCSIEEFKLYLETQFQNGMTWENHGKWHIDHKTPNSWATTEAEVIALNHYTNFQPLWAEDNIKKGNKYATK